MKPNAQRIKADLAVCDAEGPDVWLLDAVVSCDPATHAPGTCSGRTKAERTKITHYDKYIASTSASIVPMAFSTAGALGPMGMEFCAALRQRARDRLRPVSIFRMLLPASVALQRGNGRLIASYFARCGVVE